MARTQQERPPPGHDGKHLHRTAKVVQIMCSSSRSFEDAIRNGLADVRQTTRQVSGAHVNSMSIKCDDGDIVEFKVSLDVSFGIERT
jgi:flavin-binding protein dodecin